MPDIFDIDYGLQTLEHLPVDKRVEPNISIGKSLLSGLQWLRDLYLGDYKTGAVVPNYSSGTYFFGNKVIYNKAVYLCIVEFTNNPPTDSYSWQQIQQNFLGVDERVLYNGNKVVYEYALNRWFGTTFRQPNLQSDIYISNNTRPTPVFIVGDNSSDSSSSFLKTSSEFVIDSYTISNIKNFTIHVPVAVYNALGASADRDRIFRSFADKYCAEGLFYDIQTY